MIYQVLNCSAVVLVNIVFEASLKTSSLMRENVVKIRRFVLFLLSPGLSP